MNDDAINQVVTKYVEDSLSPKPAEKRYIKAKYTELREALNWCCFRSGSYPRLTANHPVHDLDVIYVVSDPSMQADPAAFMRQLKQELETAGLTNVDSIDPQTHSLTISYSDGETDFCIDVVPVIETDESDEFGKPIYIVPEVLELNKHNRQLRYQSGQAVEWIKSDPRGYIAAARALNAENTNFRIAVKLAKSWRHACKLAYGDKLRFKSFHFEQIFYHYFVKNPGVTATDAVIDCIGLIAEAIEQPQFKDRADDSHFIDDYVRDLTDEQKDLILQLQAEAHDTVSQLPGCTTEQELTKLLGTLLTVSKRDRSPVPAAAAVTRPHQFWGV